MLSKITTTVIIGAALSGGFLGTTGRAKTHIEGLGKEIERLERNACAGEEVVGGRWLKKDSVLSLETSSASSRSGSVLKDRLHAWKAARG